MARPKKVEITVDEMPKHNVLVEPKVEETPQPEAKGILEKITDKVSEVFKSEDGMSSHKKFDKFKK